MATWQKIVLLGLAGGLGTLARYGISGWVQALSGAGFPWGTFAVNAGGCLLFGLVWELGGDRAAISPEARTIVLVGFMGALTTFSTYVFETEQMLRESQRWLAMGSVVLQNAAGLACFYLGSWLGRVI